MTRPVDSNSPSPRAGGGERKRPRVLIAVAVVWGLVLAGLAVWSVRHEPATVPEQRTIGEAVPELQKATGVLLAAAGGPGRAVELGPLVYSEACRVTPVRDGVEATRDVTVHVRAGEVRTALDAIGAALPVAYEPDVVATRGKTDLSFHADAGNFIGIDADAAAADSVVRLQVSTGCRPLGAGRPEGSGPALGSPPAVLGTVLRAVGGQGAPQTAAVTCPTGVVAGTYWVDGLAVPGDLAGRLRILGTAEVIVDGAVHAYRLGADSVVVAKDGDSLRVGVSTSC